MYFDIPGPGKQNFLHKYKEIVVRRDLLASVSHRRAPPPRSRAVPAPGLGAGIPPPAAGRCLPLPAAPHPAGPYVPVPAHVVAPKSS